MLVEQWKICLISLILFPLSNGVVFQQLNGTDWNIKSVSSNLSATGQVPGTIHTILLESNLIPDPYLDFNDVQLRYLVHDDWIFTKRFSLTDDMYNADEVTLHFDQIDTVATLTLNGELLGNTNSMFVAYNFTVNKNNLKKDDNTLEVRLQSPVNYAYNQSVAYKQDVAPDCPGRQQNGECHVQFIRKEPCSFSWDWGPAFAPIGIPGDVYLEGKNQNDLVVRLESVNLASYNNTQHTWQIDIFLSSPNDPFVSNLKFVLINTDWSFETNSTIDKNLRLQLNIDDGFVSRWWPNGLGNQTLYQLVVSNRGQVIGSRLIGFRTVELVQESYSDSITGLSFYFRINSQPVFIKGSNWIPPDAFQERVTDTRLEHLLMSAKLANMNMLRVWGGGIYERDSFYDIADRLGIMLWHDFMFACSLYPVDAPFLKNIYDEVIYQVKRLQHHPSIVLWSGNNENEAAVAENWYRISKKDIPRVKDDYRTLYVDTVMKGVRELDFGQNRPFVTSSPSNGVETVSEDYIANNPQDTRYGDVHYYGYREDSWDTQTYPIARFISETGIQSLPSLETWEEATKNLSNLNFESNFVKHREHSGGKIPGLDGVIAMNLPLPITTDPLKTFIQLIYLSQINQGMTMKSISDHCRIHSPQSSINPKTSEGNTMGLMYWQINDIWQAPTWATIEYNLKWKLSHYYIKHMYSPLYPIISTTPYLPNVTDPNANVSIYLANDYLSASSGQMNCSLYGLDQFLVRSSYLFTINVKPVTVEHIADIPFSALIKSGGFNATTSGVFECIYTADDSSQYIQTFFLTRPKSYQLYPSEIQFSKFTQISPNEVEVMLIADRPALFVWLEYKGNQKVYFSKNGFHLFQPTTAVIITSWDSPISPDEVKQSLQVTTLYDVVSPQ